MQEFNGRVAVVTGGASGIGRALAKALLGEGMKVVIADVEEPALKATVEELGAGGGEVSSQVVDVSRPESVEALAEHVFRAHGACHILCNNAGVGVPSLPVWETTVNDWKWVHGVNVMGVVHGIQSFVPRMIESGEEGLVLNTSSGDGGISPLAVQSVYASSKAAVSIITECLGAQLAAHEAPLSAALFYPSGGMLNTGIWTTKRNRPAELAREKPVAEGSEPTFEQFQEGAKAAGFELPVQDLDELAADVVRGIRAGEFVIMIGREGAKAQLLARAEKIGNGECPIEAGHMGT
jgi:NAD(P)-dependent dehydrogenase (short-subunit alcohol dehydrogenase family)